MTNYLDLINNIDFYDLVLKSPLDQASLLSNRLNNTIFLKREDLQPVNSFKIRGAYNKLLHLTAEERDKGVIAASAGNHAQGVAIASKHLNIAATIVMPTTTPSIKVESVKRYGASVKLFGDTYDEASQFAYELREKTQSTFVHPYDDPMVIAGQGTIAKEILEQLNEQIPDVIFTCVGGGGLIAGICAYIKAVKPSVKIIGVEPEDSPTLHSALSAGERVVLDEVGIFADGVAVKQIGLEPFRVVKDIVSEVILVSTDEICNAIKDIYEDSRVILEPAGALSYAGIKKFVHRTKCKNKLLVGLNSGANINFHRLRHISERAEISEKNEAIFGVTIPEVQGSFKSFCKLLGKRGITEFNYRYSNSNKAAIYVGIALSEGDKEKNELIDLLTTHKYTVSDLSDDEVAKLHVRYMVGGSVSLVPDERLFRFRFPERPGALLNFLDNMNKRWNISLFHYRNHGAAYGRVLIGIQVPEVDNMLFKDSLDRIGYWYVEETHNQAYKLFL